MSNNTRGRRTGKLSAVRTAEHVERGIAAAQQFNSRKGEAPATKRFCGRLRVGREAPYYANVEAALAAVDRFSMMTKLPPPSIFHMEGGALFAVWSLTDSLDPARWAESGTNLERVARHHGLCFDGPITHELPFDFDAVVDSLSGDRGPQAKATDCLCIRLPIGPGAYANETAAIEALEGFAAAAAADADLSRPLVVGSGDAVYGVWRFEKPVPIDAWLVVARLLERLAQAYGLHLDGPVTSGPPFDLDTLVPGTPAEAGR